MSLLPPRHRWARPNEAGEQRCKCGVMRAHLNGIITYLPAAAGSKWQFTYIPCTRRKP